MLEASGSSLREFASLVAAVKSKYGYDSVQWLSSAHFEGQALIKLMCDFQRSIFNLVVDHDCIMSLFKLCLL